MGIYWYRKFIASEKACNRLIRNLRWPKGIRCPRCGYSRIWHIKESGKKDYRCKRCRYHFSLTTGTIFEKTRTPLSKWILAIGLFKVGISANQLKEEINVSYKTAWGMLHKIRSCIHQCHFLEQLKGSVEVDETYFGGRWKGKRGRGAAHKTPAIGIKERGGKVRSIVVPNVKSPTLHRVIKTHVTQGSTIYTDKWRSYQGIRRHGYGHRSLDHQKRFVRGKTHTQGIEGYWGHVKPNLVAHHRKVSPQHLQSYLSAHDFKFNERNNGDFIALILSKLINSYPLMG